MTRAGDRGDSLGGPCDASDGRQNPDFVAGPDAAIAAHIAKEACVDRRRKRRRDAELLGVIAFDPAQQRLHIVRVDMLPGGNAGSRATDRPTKLANGFSSGNVGQRELVPGFDRLSHGDVGIGQLDNLAGLNRSQRHGHIIVGVDPDCRRSALKRFGVTCQIHWKPVS